MALNTHQYCHNVKLKDKIVPEFLKIVLKIRKMYYERMGIPTSVTGTFKDAAAWQGLAGQSILSSSPIGGKKGFQGIDSHLINFQDILRAGQIKQHNYDDNRQSVAWKNLHLDVNRDDTLARTIQQIRKNTHERIASDPEMQKLLQQGHWNKQDRVAYERKLAIFVEVETSNIPALRKYRTTPPVSGASQGSHVNETAQADPNINSLSQDIDNGTQKMRFDCTTQSAIQGSIMQMVENDLLPAKAEKGNMRVRSNYFYTQGVVRFNPNDKPKPDLEVGSRHAWIISSRTGNIIEATGDGSYSSMVYKESIDPDYSFKDLVSGRPFINKDRNTYGMNLTKNNIEEELQRIARGEIIKAVKTLQESVFKNKGPSGKDPRVDGIFGPQTARALRKEYGDLNKDENVKKLSPALREAVNTLRKNDETKLFDQGKLLLSDGGKPIIVNVDESKMAYDPNRWSSHKQKGPTSKDFDGAAEDSKTYEQRLAKFHASLKGKPYNAEAVTDRLNRDFGVVTKGDIPAPPAPSTEITRNPSGLVLQPGA